MNTYVVKSGFEVNFYPPLDQKQKTDLYAQNLFAPIRELAKNADGELVVKEELDLIGAAIVMASEKAAKTLRTAGFNVRRKDTK